MINDNKMGGKVLASGGFGCVFSPALKCEGTKKRETNRISKLMTEKHTLKEYEEIEKVKSKIKNIPDYLDYFLINDITICKPEKLTKIDLQLYKKKCKALPRDSIYENNINKSLNKLLILNMPNGGLPIDDYNYLNGSFDKWYKTSNSLIKLLKNGIIPMNKQNYFHCDIKDSNVLIDETNNKFKTRLIDWGLSTEYIPFKEEAIPKTWFNRPLQFTVPFSVILFTEDFDSRYTKYIEKVGEIDDDSLRPFVINYIFFWFKKRGPGHYKFINEIFYILFSNDIEFENDNEDVKMKIIENEFTIVYISNYIIHILKKYTYLRNNKVVIKLREYLDNVFIHIVDIWGFILCYFPLLETLFSNYKNLTPIQHKMFVSIKNIYITYLYTPRIEPIEINKLINDLQDLTLLIDNEKNTNISSSISSSSNKSSSNKSSSNKSSSNKSSSNKSSSNKSSSSNTKSKTNKASITKSSTNKARGIKSHRKTSKNFFIKSSKKKLRNKNNLFLLSQIKK